MVTFGVDDPHPSRGNFASYTSSNMPEKGRDNPVTKRVIPEPPTFCYLVYDSNPGFRFKVNIKAENTSAGIANLVKYIEQTIARICYKEYKIGENCSMLEEILDDSDSTYNLRTLIPVNPIGIKCLEPRKTYKIFIN